MKLTITEAAWAIEKIIRCKLVPNLLGSPGVGKSDIVKQVADKLNLNLIDVRLAQYDPTDLNGFPSKEGNRAIHLVPKRFPLESDEIPINPKTKQKYVGWLLFLDEITSAPASVQAAAYKLVLDRQIGEYNLHKKVAIVCAGNLLTDRAVVNRMSTAMQSRLIHLEILTCHKTWLKWANENNIDYRITSFINSKPELLHNFNPAHSDNTYPSPRTWEFLHKIIHNIENITEKYIPLIEGTIGKGTANEFYGFLGLMGTLPSFKKEIMINPETAKIPMEPSSRYALTGMLSKEVNSTNVDQVMPYILRLPIEFQTIILINLMEKEKSIMNSSIVNTWVDANYEKMDI